MAISYSAIVNYGKSSLPSVESWGTNSNIIRDPPRSVMTRMRNRVGDTSAITATVADSGDRYCESINYYARGINPSVSVSYGEAGQGLNGGGSEAFLPYRVMRDGAFRPPTRRQEDLLPLSRLPRVWTSVDPKPCNTTLGERIFNCGTADSTREVHTNLLTTSCETRKTIDREPSLCAPPSALRLLKDPLAPGTTSRPSACGRDIAERERVDDVALRPTRDATSGFTNRCGTKELAVIMNNVNLKCNHPTTSQMTNKSGTKEMPVVMNNVNLKSNHPSTSQTTNKSGTKEEPIVFNNIKLKSNHPTTSHCSNRNGAIFDYTLNEADYARLLPCRNAAGEYESRPAIPAASSDHGIKMLRKVR